MGQAASTWTQLTELLQGGELAGLPALYDQDAIYLEPANPPHRGNLLIQAYLKDYLSGKSKLVIETLRTAESEDGATFAVEWTLSYDAAGRRWSDLPRATIFGFDLETGLITYQRDYQ